MPTSSDQPPTYDQAWGAPPLEKESPAAATTSPEISDASSAGRWGKSSGSKGGFGSRMKAKLSGSSSSCSSSSSSAPRKSDAKPPKQDDKAAIFSRKAEEATAMAKETGKPQLIGHDAGGKLVYVEAPQGRDNPDPEVQRLYADPGNRFIPPTQKVGFQNVFKPVDRRMGPGYKGPGYAPRGAVLGSLIDGGIIGGV